MAKLGFILKVLSMTLKMISKIVFSRFGIVLFVASLIALSLMAVNLIIKDEEDVSLQVDNNIQQVETSSILSLATEMNLPEWSDYAVEAVEWVVVAGISIASVGALSELAVMAKAYRKAKQVKRAAKAIDETQTLLNRFIRPIYKAVARPFNKAAIALVPNKPGIYLFFNKKGVVKYIGKAMNLRLRLGQHYAGKRSSGNALISKNSRKLSFVVIPSKSLGESGGAIKCMEAITIKLFDNGNLYNKRIETVNFKDCKQIIVP